MKIDKRLTLLGVMLVILSTVMASQYATTKVTYSYDIVHPSNADIRFVGSDNSSEDGTRLLRIEGSNGTNSRVTLNLGDWAQGTNKTYTAAFAIVNEEPFALNITHVTVTNYSDLSDYMQIWVHGNGSQKAENDNTSVYIYNNGSQLGYDSDTVVWQMARGDTNPWTMTSNISGLSPSDSNLSTNWDSTANVRYCENLYELHENGYPIGLTGLIEKTVNNASDFVWVQISINLPQNITTGSEHGGTINFNFEASTRYGTNP